MSAEAYGQIMSNLEGITGQAEGSFTTGKFQFNEADMREIINEWHELAESYRGSIENAHRMTQVEGPGLDYVSQSYAEAANAHGRSYKAYVESAWKYCQEQAELCQKALDKYLGMDTAAADQMNKTHPGEQDSPPAI